MSPWLIIAFGGVASHALAKQCSVAPGKTPRQRSRAHDAYVWWGADKVSMGGGCQSCTQSGAMGCGRISSPSAAMITYWARRLRSEIARCLPVQTHHRAFCPFSQQPPRWTQDPKGRDVAATPEQSPSFSEWKSPELPAVLAMQLGRRRPPHPSSMAFPRVERHYQERRSRWPGKSGKPPTLESHSGNSHSNGPEKSCSRETCLTLFSPVLTSLD